MQFDESAQYPGEAVAVMNFVVGTLSNCETNSGIPPTSLYLSFSISCEGKVLSVKSLKPNQDELLVGCISEDCIQNMALWIPAKLNGEKVCSNFKLPISCLKWK
jgi:hypothetical protein